MDYKQGAEMAAFLVVGGVIWLVWSFLNGFIAEQKNRSSGKILLLSLLLSPLLGYLYILAVPALSGARDSWSPSSDGLRTMTEKEHR